MKRCAGGPGLIFLSVVSARRDQDARSDGRIGEIREHAVDAEPVELQVLADRVAGVVRDQAPLRASYQIFTTLSGTVSPCRSVKTVFPLNPRSSSTTT